MGIPGAPSENAGELQPNAAPAQEVQRMPTQEEIKEKMRELEENIARNMEQTIANQQNLMP